MTAIGFLLITVAVFLSKILGKGHPFEDNWWDIISYWLFFIGLLNITVGVSLFLYKVMP